MTKTYGMDGLMEGVLAPSPCPQGTWRFARSSLVKRMRQLTEYRTARQMNALVSPTSRCTSTRLDKIGAHRCVHSIKILKLRSCACS